MCVCMYVYMHVHVLDVFEIFTCMHFYMHVRTCVRMCTGVCMYVCLLVCVLVCLLISVMVCYVGSVRKGSQVCMHACMHVCRVPCIFELTAEEGRGVPPLLGISRLTPQSLASRSVRSKKKAFRTRLHLKQAGVGLISLNCFLILVLTLPSTCSF